MENNFKSFKDINWTLTPRCQIAPGVECRNHQKVNDYESKKNSPAKQARESRTKTPGSQKNEVKGQSHEIF